MSIDLSRAFGSCPIPTLILEAKWDLTWNADKPDKIHKNHPGSKLVVFEESGHSPFKDEPERFFTVLREFVEHIPGVSEAGISRWKDYLWGWRN